MAPKKAPPKAAAAAAPPPAAAAAAPPVVEEPPKEEEVKEEPPPGPQYNANQQRVLFAQLPIKEIVSFHSGSILAQEDPLPIEMPAKKVIELKNVFAAFASMMTVSASSTASDQPVSHFAKANNALKTPLSPASPVVESVKPPVEDGPTLTEARVSSSQLLAMVLKLHSATCAEMSLDKFYLQEVIDFYLPPSKDQSPPPPPVAAPPVVAAAPPPAAKGKAAAPPPVVEPPEPVPTPGIPADGVVRVSSLNETDFVRWYERYYADPFFYGQRMRLFAGRGLVQEVKQLLHRQCGINTANGEGLTTLHYACEFNRVDVIDTLSRFGGKALLVNAQDKHGWTPLHSAVHHGNIACVKRLLEMPEIKIEVTDRFGKTPLHCAVTQNRGVIVFLLLSKGADILAKDIQGLTPLHEAAFRGHDSLYGELVVECKKRNIHEDIAEQRDRIGRRPADYLISFEEKLSVDGKSSKKASKGQ